MKNLNRIDDIDELYDDVYVPHYEVVTDSINGTKVSGVAEIR